MTPSTSSSRGYFSGPEGKVNATTWGAIAVAAFFVVYLMGGQVGDFLVSAADNTLHLIISCAVLLFMAACLMDPKKRCWYLFRAIIRWLTSMFINLDPIGIRKSYVERVQAKYEQFTKAVDTLRGQLIGTRRKAAINAKELADQSSLFQAAAKRNDTRAETLLAKDIRRKETLRDQYTNSIESLAKSEKIVVRYQEICADTITDMQADIKFREEQMALTQATRGITGGIKAILKGLPEKDMYDEAGDVLDNQYDATLGAFDNVLDMTKDILTSADLHDDAALQSALAKFELNNAGVVIGIGEKQTTGAAVMKQIAAPAVYIPARHETTTSGSATDYSEFLK